MKTLLMMEGRENCANKVKNSQLYWCFAMVNIACPVRDANSLLLYKTTETLVN